MDVGELDGLIDVVGFGECEEEHFGAFLMHLFCLVGLYFGVLLYFLGFHVLEVVFQYCLLVNSNQIGCWCIGVKRWWGLSDKLIVMKKRSELIKIICRLRSSPGSVCTCLCIYQVRRYFFF